MGKVDHPEASLLLSPSPRHSPSHRCSGTLGSTSALACLSPPAPLSPSAYRGSLCRRISQCRCPLPIRCRLQCTPGLAVRLGVHSARVETRSCALKTPLRTAVSSPAPWLVG